jgi:hypothetical protein
MSPPVQEGLGPLAVALSSPSTALLLVARLVGVAVFVASLELLRGRRRTLGVDGVLPWGIVRREHARLPRPARAALDAVLGDRGFFFVVVARLLAALALLVEPDRTRGAIVVVFVTSLLVSIRFRGRENGASDAMTNLVTLALAVAAVAPTVVAVDRVDVDRVAVVFIAAQALLSYVAAGLAKMRSPSWRRGSALGAFVAVERFGAPVSVRRVLGLRVVGRLAGYGVIAWQLASPLALTSTTACVAFCVLGLGFHVVNFAVFGLNRFVFAWCATYPAIVCCAALVAR